MATSAGTRLLKWLGDPPAVGEDLWRVPNWRYENRRTIALHHFASFKIDQSFIPGLSKSYEWHKDLPHYLLEVEAYDASLILAAYPNMFRDVTSAADPEVEQHEELVMLRDRNTGKVMVMPKSKYLDEVARQRMKHHVM
jgi:hypothetical protein